ncbi:MAG: alpha/beta hydrolase [Hyphomicrobiaceae bacterium]|nr:alpha/beta hydrolase [Hyphomicrobiaceae bacterium]
MTGRTFVVCHGAWSAAFAWKKVRPLIRAKGHEIFTPTYTGLGARAHHAGPGVDLEMHVADVLGVLEMEDLSDVVLVGHSYGGMVATGVADRARARIRQLIYVDAHVPADGQSLADITPGRPLNGPAPFIAGGAPQEWLMAPNDSPSDTSPEDVAWLAPRRKPQPKATFTQKLVLRNGPLTLPRAYIHCTKKDGADVFAQYRRLKQDPAWTFVEMAASHSPNVTAPEALAEILVGLVR